MWGIIVKIKSQKGHVHREIKDPGTGFCKSYTMEHIEKKIMYDITGSEAWVHGHSSPAKTRRHR